MDQPRPRLPRIVQDELEAAWLLDLCGITTWPASRAPRNAPSSCPQSALTWPVPSTSGI